MFPTRCLTTCCLQRVLRVTGSQVVLSQHVRNSPQNGLPSRKLNLAISRRLFDKRLFSLHSNQAGQRRLTSVNKHEYDSARTLCDKPNPDDKSNNASPKKDNILTVPNLLCVSRIIAAPYLAHLIFQGNFSWAAGIFVYAGFTDLLDGWIARKFPGQASSLGSFLDPLADKILVGTLFLSLTYVNMIPASLTGLVVSRDLFLIYAGLYIRYMSVVPPFTLKKYFDISLPTAQVQPTTISKVNTCLQFLLLATTLGSPLLGYMDHPWLHYLWAATGTTTFLSAVSYAFLKDTYKFSHREYDHQLRKKVTAFVLFVLFNVGFTLFFPSQTRLSQSTASECPITGQGSNSRDCPIITEGDLYKDRSMDYYRKKAHSMEEK